MQIKNYFFTLVFSFAILASCKNNAQETNLDVSQFEKAIAQQNIQILDVRTPGEFQSGHMKNALQADWNNETEFKDRVETLDKNQPVYTYCLSGGRSAAATDYLIKNGFKAYNLSGGIMAWKNAGMPLDIVEPKKQISLTEYQAQIPIDKTVLVDFGADWCPPCKKMNPVIDSLVKTNGNQFVLVKINGGDQTEIVKELKIDAFPTFIIYKQGKEIWRKMGIVEPKEFLANM